MKLALKERTMPIDLGTTVVFSPAKIEELNEIVSQIFPSYYLFPHYSPEYNEYSSSYESLSICAILNLYALMVDCGSILFHYYKSYHNPDRILTQLRFRSEDSARLVEIKDKASKLRTHYAHNTYWGLHQINAEIEEYWKNWRGSPKTDEDWKGKLRDLVNDGEEVYSLTRRALVNYQQRWRTAFSPQEQADALGVWKRAIIDYLSDEDTIYKWLLSIFQEAYKTAEGRPFVGDVYKRNIETWIGRYIQYCKNHPDAPDSFRSYYSSGNYNNLDRFNKYLREICIPQEVDSSRSSYYAEDILDELFGDFYNIDPCSSARVWFRDGHRPSLFSES